MARCPRTELECRQRDIAQPAGLSPKRDHPWNFGGRCPVCGRTGFAVEASTSYRHYWTCRASAKAAKTDPSIQPCQPADIRAALAGLGIPDACLGDYAIRQRPAAGSDREKLAQIRTMLADPKLHKPADLRIRLWEVFHGEAPHDYRAFVAFARAAGVGRTQAQDAAGRWGRGFSP